MICVNRGSKNVSPSDSPRDEEEGIELIHDGIIERIGNEGVTVHLEAVVRKTGIFMLHNVEVSCY